MLNLNSQLRANAPQQNQISMQGKNRKSQQKPLENVLFDNPVQKAKSAAISAGKVGFVVGTIGTYLNIAKERRNELIQNNLFTDTVKNVAEKTVETAEPLVKPLQEKAKGLVKSALALKPGDIKKAALNFLSKPMVQKVTDNVAHVVGALIGGVHSSLKLALPVGTVVLGLGTLVKFADNQAIINKNLKKNN